MALEPVTYRRVIALSWPVALAGATTPLLGLIDTWAIGNSPRPLDIGAIALGGLIFTIIYWTFGFLRMSSAGLTAQARGVGDKNEIAATLFRGVGLAAALSLAIMVLQWPIKEAAFAMMKGGPTVEAGAGVYFDIRIWAAPPALISYAMLGWFIGMGRTGLVLIHSVFINSMNAGLDLWFVVGLDWGVAGVAWGTLLSEYAALALDITLAAWLLARIGAWTPPWRLPGLTAIAPIKRMVSVNSDIFIRTVLLTLSFAWFTNESAGQGDVILAANQILLQFILFAGFALDGPALAAEGLVGGSIGAKDGARYRLAVRKTGFVTLIAAVLFAGAYALFGAEIVAALTAAPEVREVALTYAPWAILGPLAMAWPFHMDGVFIGATRGREMRNAMIVSVAVYAVLWAVLTPAFGNHGLWAAFLLYFIVRGGTLAALLPKIGREIPVKRAPA